MHEEAHNTMKRKLIVFIMLLLCCLISEIFASDIIWLSNTPPPQSRDSYQTYGMHRLSSIRERRGNVKLLCWIRSGTLPESSRYLTNINPDETVSLVFSPDGKPVKNQVSAYNGEYALSYEGIEEGFYNAYLLKQFIQGDTLFVINAKAELLTHSCRNGHDKALLKKIEPRIYPEHIPFEIVRERLPGENFHTFISSGDSVTYTAMLNGETISRANITLCTQKGWNKTLQTNDSGQSTFQFISDYFSRWEELNRRNIYYYLFIAEYTINKEGSYKGLPYQYIHYIGTLSDGYFPSKTMYSSLVWALVIFVLAVSLPVIAVYIYRERRKNPFKEIAFHEKD